MYRLRKDRSHIAECVQAETRSDSGDFNRKLIKLKSDQEKSAVQMMKLSGWLHIIHFQPVVQIPLATGFWAQQQLATCALTKLGLLSLKN